MSSGGKKVSRRSTLAATSGLLMLGSGLGAVLVAPGARAAEGTKLVLKLHKLVGKKKKLIGTIELPEELVDKLAEASADPLKLVVERGTDKARKVIGEKELTDGSKLSDAAKAAKKKKKPSKQ